jgi:small GTP-binding protein
MMQKKVCMLGAFAVGKTSLVARFVESIFSDKYYTTVGVRISRKSVREGRQQCHLIVWDLAGEDEFLQIRLSYLRGASGYLLVVDGTRPTTLDAAVNIQKRVREALGDVPFVVLLNKADLQEEWEVSDDTMMELADKGWSWFKTSAKTGMGVEDAFLSLTDMMLGV